ncbi:MAG: alpha/beta hydrolase [Pseudomonadota bacterium]
MADYSKLIDAETWAFIEKTAGFYPAETVTYGIEDQRRVYNEMCRGFYAGRPEGVAVEDREFGGVPCRRYSVGGGGAAVMYFHGGGFVVGDLDSHDDVCAELCSASGCDVVSVHYRLAPEHKHPAAYDDAMVASRAVAGEFGLPLVLCGDSAGGNLAAAVAHMGRDMDLLGQVLIYPGLGGDFDKGSYIEHAEAPMLRRDEIVFYKDVRLTGEEPVGDPSYAPLHDASFEGVPPTVLITAECDPLSDDGVDYERALQGAGVAVHRVNEPGLVHGYLRARHDVGRARESFARICAAVTALSNREWPYG